VNPSPRPAALILGGSGSTEAANARSVRLLGSSLLTWALRNARDAGAAPLAFAAPEQDTGDDDPSAAALPRLPRDGGLSTAAGLAGAGTPLLALPVERPLVLGSSLRALIDAQRASGAAATLLVSRGPVPEGGCWIERGPDGQVAALRPGGAAVSEFSLGVAVFHPAALARSTPPAARSARLAAALVDATLAALVARGERVLTVALATAEEALVADTPAGLAACAVRLRDRRVEELLAAGVLIEDPSSTWVGPLAEVSPAALLRPFTWIEGRSRVGAGASVGPFARLVDADVGAGAQVLDHCLLVECSVGAGASVGPFAHLRPETSVGPRARVGNFVELKKTRLGEGSKAPHLSYLGDAEIGPGVNIGAGTITCNYDGVLKHPTRIEAGAFVGSDATLVAPVTIGSGAYVGAGSTITKDVPADSLAVARAQQVVKPGWAARRRAARTVKREG
jgi:bifunctional UDP-N-acetylglucosamine pyrophosphorylase/glucosamine-1-phosphate N-acetyltransferase